MKRNIFLKFSVILVFITSLMSFAPAGGLSVIVNGSVPNKDMTMVELKAFMKGAKTRWSDNSKVNLVFVNPTSSFGNQVAKAVFGTSGSDMNKALLALAFQGKISAPKFFDTEEEVAKYVKNTPGTIAIVGSDATGGATKAKINGADSF
jgi:ABC-type phosphate transport system substrate-binding protein